MVRHVMTSLCVQFEVSKLYIISRGEEFHFGDSLPVREIESRLNQTLEYSEELDLDPNLEEN